MSSVAGRAATRCAVRTLDSARRNQTEVVCISPSRKRKELPAHYNGAVVACQSGFLVFSRALGDRVRRRPGIEQAPRSLDVFSPSTPPPIVSCPL